MTSPTTTSEPNLSLVVTHLMKGVLYRDTHEAPWNDLLQLQSAVRDYVAVIGLTVYVDESEGYAFLRSRPDDEIADDGRPPIPRLIARRSLSFHVSLLLALLRKKLIEHDVNAASSEKLVLSREQTIDMVRVFLPDNTNDARLVDQIDSHISKVVDLGFLRKIKGQSDHYEVRRILKAFVDGQWLADFDQRLAEYAALIDNPEGGDEP